VESHKDSQLAPEKELFVLRSYYKKIIFIFHKFLLFNKNNFEMKRNEMK
jgi:hypothetical protein